MTQLDPAESSAGALDPTEVGRVQRPSRFTGLWRFTWRRLLTAAGTLVFVLLANFFLFQVLPGDPLARYKGARNISTEDLQALETSWTPRSGSSSSTTSKTLSVWTRSRPSLASRCGTSY